MSPTTFFLEQFYDVNNLGPPTFCLTRFTTSIIRQDGIFPPVVNDLEMFMTYFYWFVTHVIKRLFSKNLIAAVMSEPPPMCNETVLGRHSLLLPLGIVTVCHTRDWSDRLAQRHWIAGELLNSFIC